MRDRARTNFHTSGCAIQGSLGIAYTDVKQRTASNDIYGPLNTLLYNNDSSRTTNHTCLLSATYSRDLFGRAFAYISTYDNIRSHDNAIMLGISARFGRKTSLDGSYATATHQATVEVSKPETVAGDIGYRLYAAAGESARALADVRYMGNWGDVGLGADNYGGRTYIQGEARGAIVMMGRALFATNTVTDGFAIVDDGGFGNVGVLVNNRPIGRTDANGHLLVPNLVSYQGNKVAIDPTDLPLDAEWDQLESTVVPSDRSGVVARFRVRLYHQVLLRILLTDGTVIPVGSVVSIDGLPAAKTAAGFDGQVFFNDLSGRHTIRIDTTDNKQCIIDNIDLPASSGQRLDRQVTCTTL